MKKELHISAAFDKPELLQNLVERLAYRHFDLGFSSEPMPAGYKALETSTTETFVGGTVSMDMDTDGDHIDMPFITSFLFTCVKGKTEPYQLIWSCSLN